MLERCSFERQSPRSIFRWGTRASLLAGAFVAMVTLSGDASPLHAADEASPSSADLTEPSPPLASGVLEHVVYRHGDDERTATAVVTVVGTRIHLAIFSPILATEHEVRIESTDLISSRRLTDEERDAELAHRRSCIAERERKREIARQKREERKRRELEELAKKNAGAPRTRAEREARAALQRENATVDAGELDRFAEDLTRRLDEVTVSAGALLGEVLARKKVVPSRARELRAIQVWVEEVEIAAEGLERRLAVRHRSRDRLREDVESGEVRARVVTEELAAMFDQYAVLEGEIEEAETILVDQRQAFAALPESEPEPAPEPVEETTLVADTDPGAGPIPAGEVAPVAAPTATQPPAAAAFERVGAARDESRAGESTIATAERAVSQAENSQAENSRAGDRGVSSEATVAPAREADSTEEAESESDDGAATAASPADGRLPIWPLYILASLAVVLAWRRRPAPSPPVLISRMEGAHGEPKRGTSREKDLTSRSGKPGGAKGPTTGGSREAASRHAATAASDFGSKNIGLEILEDETFFRGDGVPMTPESPSERGSPDTLPGG